MPNVVNLEACFARFADTFSPKIVGELNGQYVLVVRVEGDEVPWHRHENEDELFWVLEGRLDILERDKTTTVNAGEFYIVPSGTEHRVVPHGHVKLVLFEPAGIAHTGKARSEITKSQFDRLDSVTRA